LLVKKNPPGFRSPRSSLAASRLPLNRQDGVAYAARERKREGEAMDEREWMTCTSPQEMLEYLKGKASDRKLRLFACACCRRIWHHLSDHRSREAIEVSEQYADGLVVRDRLQGAETPAAIATFDAWGPAYSASCAAALAATASIREKDLAPALYAAVRAAEAVASQAAETAHRAAEGATASSNTIMLFEATAREAKTVAEADEHADQAALLREIFGNPFRPAAIDSTWRTPTVLSLAQAAYENRILPAGELDTSRLAILADALEDAGCNSADILAHLRAPGPHVRGCWPVDLLLKKE
jgi:hypothetical protein